MPPNLNKERAYPTLYPEEPAAAPSKMNHLRSLLGTQPKTEEKKSAKSKSKTNTSTATAIKTLASGSNQLRVSQGADHISLDLVA